MEFSYATDTQAQLSNQSFWKRKREWALLAVETRLSGLSIQPKVSSSKSKNRLLFSSNIIKTQSFTALDKSYQGIAPTSLAPPNTTDIKNLSSSPLLKNSIENVPSRPQSTSPNPSTSCPRFNKIQNIINSPSVDLESLQKACWGGVPYELRSVTWQILMGYLPCNANRRNDTKIRKHKDYFGNIEKTFIDKQDSLDSAIWHQISIDIPRTYADIPMFKSERLRDSLARVLYCWAIRHPASGYVQGMNDLASIFYAIFVSNYLDIQIFDITPENIENISKSDFEGVEADCFWCLTNLIGKIHDSYTFTQPGIQRQIIKLKDLVQHINPALYKHFEKEGVQFLLFSFRWFNCLLIREFTTNVILRIWDTYLSEEDGFSNFHLYTCTALLLKWADTLLKMDFSEIVLFLQSPPSLQWSEKEVEILLSEAYTYKSIYSYSALLQQRQK
ncbi:hypothetical protein BB561_004754 [Smittium simulii]|uniref:Rab-GAP TBC domain-containing protein n=1 Tax=Smittium simulii TaxID=133385 RepID=A0A2T9YEE7_9FUNG|nr:hypothetical protein BB561_004754 [Smittium simulii]